MWKHPITSHRSQFTLDKKKWFFWEGERGFTLSNLQRVAGYNCFDLFYFVVFIFVQPCQYANRQSTLYISNYNLFSLYFILPPVPLSWIPFELTWTYEHKFRVTPSVGKGEKLNTLNMSKEYFNISNSNSYEKRNTQ